MNTPQCEFNQSFAENMEHIKEALSGDNEEEESINTENKPSSAKLALMMSDFLNGMSSQVTKWKNFALGNVNSLEILSQILQEIGNQICITNIGPKDEQTSTEHGEWIKSTFTTKFPGLKGETTLFEQV